MSNLYIDFLKEGYNRIVHGDWVDKAQALISAYNAGQLTVALLNGNTYSLVIISGSTITIYSVKND